MDAASSELEEAATHGQLRHTDMATEHAVKHIQGGFSARILIFLTIIEVATYG